MRRVVGLCLVGLGIFLIVFAIVLPAFIVGQVTKFPTNEFTSSTLVANNAAYFDAASLTEKSPVTVHATYTLKGDAAAGTSSTAVWQEFNSVEDITNGIAVQYQSRTFAFDRKSAQLVPYSGDSVNGKPTAQTGVVGYVFPIGDKKQTYDVYDSTLGKPVPFAYSGTSTIDGVQAYAYAENVTPTKIGTISVPGSLIGSTASSVAAPEYYSIHVLYYIDPVTGVLIDATEHEVEGLYSPSTNTQALTLFNANLVMTPASVTALVHVDNNGRHELTLLKIILPVVLGVVGLIALIVGFLLSRGPREDVEAGPTTPAPERAAEPAERTRASLVPGLDDEHTDAESGQAAVTAEQARHEDETQEFPAAEAEPAEETTAAAAEEPAAEEQAAAERAAAEEPAAESATAEERAEPAEAQAAEPEQTAPAEAAVPNGAKPAATSPKHRRRTAKTAAEPESGAS